MRQQLWFTEVYHSHRHVPQLTVCQTPGSDTVTEQSVHSASVWLHRLSSRPGSRWPVDMELHLLSAGRVSVQLPGVKPKRRAGELHLGGAERHAHRHRRGVVHPLQLYLCTGNLQLQEETTWTHQTIFFRWDFIITLSHKRIISSVM